MVNEQVLGELYMSVFSIITGYFAIDDFELNEFIIRY